MKRFCILPIMLGIALCFACSDDKDGDESLHLNGIYADDALKLTYSDVEYPGKTVEFSSKDEKIASLTLNGIIPGEMETVISGVELMSDNSGYQLTGKDENIDRTVDLAGKIEKGKLTLGVNVKFDNALIGKWLLDEKNPGNIIWKTYDGKPVTLAKLTYADGREVPLFSPLTTKKITGGAPTLLKKVVDYLQDVSFGEDGNLLATYNAKSETSDNWTSLETNSIHYRVLEDTTCCIYPNVDALTRQMNTDALTGENVSMLQQLWVNGIPLYFRLKENTDPKTLYMYLGKEYIKQMIPLIKLMGAFVPEDTKIEIPISEPSMYMSLKELLTNLPEALEKTETLEIGLNFVISNN